MNETQWVVLQANFGRIRWFRLKLLKNTALAIHLGVASAETFVHRHFLGLFRGRCRTRRKPYQPIERAEAHSTGEQEDDGDHQGYRTEGARQGVGKKQHCRHCGDDYAEDAVEIAHVLFHRSKRLGE